MTAFISKVRVAEINSEYICWEGKSNRRNIIWKSFKLENIEENTVKLGLVINKIRKLKNKRLNVKILKTPI